MSKLPLGFGYLQDPRIICEILYYTNDNFIGCPVNGYNKPVCIATEPLLIGLSKVQDDLDRLQKNYVLKVFDAYRPQTAVNHFERWSHDAQDIKTKDKYYPDLSKRDLFAQGYILTRSTHSRGGAVDLTIVQIDSQDPQKHVELDMGTIFDFFGDASHTDYSDLNPEAKVNRQMLRSIMEKHGFKNYPQEWWHYNIVDEVYPNTYFDFPIE